MQLVSNLFVLHAVLFCYSRCQHVDSALHVADGVLGLDKSSNEKTECHEQEDDISCNENRQASTKDESLQKSDAQLKPQLLRKQYNQTKANWQFSEDLSEVMSKSPIYQASSPIFIQLLLSLLIYGAEGQTLHELTNALHYDHVKWTELSAEEKKHELALILSEINESMDRSVNLGIFVSDDCPLKTDFQEFIKKYITSINITVQKLDYQEAYVDNWINSQLANIIIKFRGGDMKGGSRFVLAIGAQLNAVFPEYTRYSVMYEGLFYLPCGQSTYVNYFTTLGSGLVCYAENENYTAIVRSLGGNTESLLVAPKGMDVGYVSVDIGDVLKKCVQKKVRMTYPIYSPYKHDDLEVLLSKLGVTSLFCPDAADFKGLFNTKENVYIRDAYVDVTVSLSNKGLNTKNAIIANGNSNYDSFCTSEDTLVAFDRPISIFLLNKSQVVMTYYVSL